MKTARLFHSAFIVVALAAGGLPALGDDSFANQPLLQVKYDRLIPTSFPTVSPNFAGLRQTAFNRLIPTTASPIPANFNGLSQITFNRLLPTIYPR